MTNPLAALFAYKQWADAELLAAIGSLSPEHAQQQHTAIRILNHIRVVDEIFMGHLSGQPHGHSATNTPDTPRLDELATLLRGTGQWYINFCNSLPWPMLGETLPFTFTDGDAGKMTREEMLMHVNAHGTYHRGAAGRILVQCGLGAPRDLYTRFLHSTQPERRAV